MSVENVKPISGGTPPAESRLPMFLDGALREQQKRIWQLRSLLEAVKVATRAGDKITDPEAALEGLVDFAEVIYLGLDERTLLERALTLEETAGPKDKRGAQAIDLR